MKKNLHLNFLSLQFSFQCQFQFKFILLLSLHTFDEFAVKLLPRLHVVLSLRLAGFPSSFSKFAICLFFVLCRKVRFGKRRISEAEREREEGGYLEYIYCRARAAQR